MNPSLKWDLVPVYGVYMVAPGDDPVQGRVEFRLSQRVTRTDGRTIYPDGAKVSATIGAADEQDPDVRAAVRTAWRASDEALLGAGFDGALWDVWWDTKVLPAAIFTGFPASDDPDILQRDWRVTVKEALTGANGREYAIQPLLAHLVQPIPGINLGTVEVPPGSPTVPAPVYAKGIAGGVAALDADGDVVDAAGAKVTGGDPAQIGQVVETVLTEDGPVKDALNATFVGSQTTAAQESATVGAELAVSTGWALGAGWTGDFAAGFTHTPGSTAPLTWTPPFTTGTDVFVVEWKWDGVSTDQDVYAGYDVTLGGGSAGIIYQGAAPSNVQYSRGIKSLADGTLVFAPWTTFEGRIHSISVRKLAAAAPVGVGWRDSDGLRTAELRFGKSAQLNIHLGIDSGRWSVSGRSNVAVGDYALSGNVTGFFNVAMGREALATNVNGTRNVALGYRALRENISGDRNVGIGPFALTRLTTGQRNVALGVDTLWRLEDGNDNIGVGYLTQTEIRHGHENIAIGRYAMQHTHGAADGSTANNIAIGTEALGRATGASNIGIGRRALASQTTANFNVAIGDYALERSVTGAQQTAIGRSALRYFTGGRNTAIGNAALAGVEGASTGTRNVAIGDNAGMGITSGSNNTIIGPSAAASLTTGSGNILIGFAAEGQPNASSTNRLNIGNVLRGKLDTGQLSVSLQDPTARFHLPPGQATAGMAPLKLHPTGSVLLTTPEDGAVEFDGTDLYITAGGVRYKLTKTEA